ncbi:MAG TPA: M12 family metallo-peptidase [Polyangia bacterium]|jgi:hypothetical protein|nr:M12 family metallo-peptidase [Polyangia bacterium]
MLRYGKWILAAALVSISADNAIAKDCTFEDCSYSNATCYLLAGPRWCQLATGGPYGHYTPVNAYNHTSYTAINTSWNDWNYPPAGQATNSLYITTDNVNNYNHDIDYDRVSNSGVAWWGYTTYSNTGSCLNRGSAHIQMNGYYIDGNTSRQLITAIHETGHAIGLGHVCTCAAAMVPCLNCGLSNLAPCDAQGANALYH